MSKKNKLLSVLSDAEQEALYGLPEFDDAQQLEYLAVTETELALANSRPSLHAKVYCLLQIGYFKAKHAFFSFDWDEVEDDCAFVLSRYFHGEVFEPRRSPSMNATPSASRSPNYSATGRGRPPSCRSSSSRPHGPCGVT
uniref:DUF4158 domain-containing protein n=1 Tax=Klebsiella pneumoniae TaxID=573 RepID=A0A2P1BNC9_KLEPN|nr:hypothetical protein [Klebsiella pneumoniae]